MEMEKRRAGGKVSIKVEYEKIEHKASDQSINALKLEKVELGGIDNNYQFPCERKKG
jgi:hypothetical protein